MKVAWKLARAYALGHPVRMLLTSLAVIAAACMVVWVVSSYDAMVSRYEEKAEEYLGRYDCFVVPEDPDNAIISPELIAELRQSPEVAEVAPTSQTKIRIVNRNAMPAMDPMSGGMGPGHGRGPGGRPYGGRSPGPSGADSQAPESNTAEKGDADKRPSPPPSRRGRRDMRALFGLRGQPSLVGTDADNPPYPIIEGKWIDPSKPNLREVVVSKNAAERFQAAPGDEILGIHGMKEYRVEVAGVIDQAPGPTGFRMPRPRDENKSPTGLDACPAAAAVYVTPALAEKFTRGEAVTNLVNIKLTEKAKQNIGDFLNRWDKRIRDVEPRASILGAADIRSGMEENFPAARAKRQAWAATGLALLAALFIIFTTLSMGVTERIRQFAVMRSVGLARGQVAKVIAVEGMILALIGWGGGLLAGWGLLILASRAQPTLFAEGAALGTWCVLFSGASAFGGALAASILPAWQATNVEPLDAMSPRRSSLPSVAWASMSAGVGLALIAMNPILVYAAEIPDAKRYALYEAVGCTSMAIGFLLLAPAAILSVEATIGPLVGRLLEIEPRLLRSQLAGNLWRTLGATAALCVGLGLFVAMQVWGYSMLQPFKPGKWVPDALVAFQTGGIPDGEIETIRNTPGVIPERFLPLAVEQPRLADDVTGSRERVSVIRQGNVIMIGLDPEIAFGGDDPLIDADFTDGNAGEAIAKLKEGGYCIVPDHFLRATGLNVGDGFTTVPPETPNRRVAYKIAGAVSLPGWHWMTKFSGLRKREGRTAAIVFADYDDVRRDFNLPRTNFFWMDVDEKYGKRHLEEVRKAEEAEKAARTTDSENRPSGIQALDLEIDAKRAAVVKIGRALEPLAARNRGEVQPVNAQGTWSFGAEMFGPSVRITTPDQVRRRITDRASGMIWAMCRLPLITLLVTSLGVVNTVMASVRARRWEFGVLRSIGVTRWGLFRMVIAEGILIGLVTCLLSLGFGVMAGWCGTGISQHVSFFGGLETPLVVPWARLSLGFGLALVLCLLAALWPAVLTCRTEPLKLLQEGRAAL